MNTISQNFGQNAPLGGISGIPGAPGRVAAPQAPQAPADQVSLGQAPPAPAPPQPQVVQTPSGVQAQVLKDQQSVAFQAALPAGVLLPVPVLLEGVSDGRQGQVQAVLANNPQAPLPAAVGTDGRVYVQVEAGAPLVSFDPVTLDYGLSSPLTVDGMGTQHRQMQELVHADGSRTIVHDEQIKPGMQPGSTDRTFTRIDVRGGALSAAQVTAHEGGAAPQKTAMDKGVEVGMAMMTGGLSLLLGSGAQKPQETALTAQLQPNGSIALGGGSFLDHAKNSATGGMKFDSPLMNWWKGRNAPTTTIVPFSATLAANPGAVFPGLMASLSGGAPA